jgi:hypothetical protein
LEPSWSRLGSVVAVAALDAACVGVHAAMGRYWTAREPLLGALVTVSCCRSWLRNRNYNIYI